MIAMLVLRSLEVKSEFVSLPSNLAPLLRHQLFIYTDLFVRLDAPFEGTPQLGSAAKGKMAPRIMA